MTDLRKAAEMALDAMLSEYSTGGENKYLPWDVIEALRQALAQPEQAPVGMTCKVWTHGCALFDGIDLPNETLLYAAPPKREWVGLTDDEINKIVDLNTSDDGGFDIWCDGIAVAHIVCAKIKELNK